MQWKPEGIFSGAMSSVVVIAQNTSGTKPRRSGICRISALIRAFARLGVDPDEESKETQRENQRHEQRCDPVG